MSSAITVASGQIEEFLQHRVAEIAGVTPSSVSLSTALSCLGVDSLGMLHLIEGIESEQKFQTRSAWTLSPFSRLQKFWLLVYRAHGAQPLIWPKRWRPTANFRRTFALRQAQPWRCLDRFC